MSRELVQIKMKFHDKPYYIRKKDLYDQTGFVVVALSNLNYMLWFLYNTMTNVIKSISSKYYHIMS